MGLNSQPRCSLYLSDWPLRFFLVEQYSSARIWLESSTTIDHRGLRKRDALVRILTSINPYFL